MTYPDLPCGRARSFILAGAALIGLTALGTAGQAHHSFAAFFDSNREVTITGTVTEFRFTNPHGTIALEVREADGTLRQWRAETNAPVVLMRRGWTRTSIKPGDRITIDGWLARDGKPYIRLRRALDADGRLIGSSPFGQGDG